jgi:hypothetical protein
MVGAEGRTAEVLRNLKTLKALSGSMWVGARRRIEVPIVRKQPAVPLREV